MTTASTAQRFVLSPLEQMFEPRELSGEGLAMKTVDIVKGGAAVVGVSLLAAGLGYLGGDVPPMLANEVLKAAKVSEEAFRVAAGYGLPNWLGVVLNNPEIKQAAAHQVLGGIGVFATSLYTIVAPIASRLNPNYKG